MSDNGFEVDVELNSVIFGALEHSFVLLKYVCFKLYVAISHLHFCRNLFFYVTDRLCLGLSR